MKEEGGGGDEIPLKSLPSRQIPSRYRRLRRRGINRRTVIGWLAKIDTSSYEARPTKTNDIAGNLEKSGSGETPSLCIYPHDRQLAPGRLPRLLSDSE